MNAKCHLPRGPVVIDVAGTALTDEERDRLQHPLVGGVILFSRNFSNSAALKALTAEIHALREPALLIAVDHEGGRVQRFRTDGFTRLPAMRQLGAKWEHNPHEAQALAQAVGYVLAADLINHGIDLSFAPVLDLDYGHSQAIGSRALHRDPSVVAVLAGALASGMTAAGMGSVGKHFPGHGFVEADSHHEIPIDPRAFDLIWNKDLKPYYTVGHDGLTLLHHLTGIMPAHVIYKEVDTEPAGFSHVWLQTVLRDQLGFNGIIFSDDLNMQGAMGAGDIVDRATAACQAGCDMVLVCNQPHEAEMLLQNWRPHLSQKTLTRLAALRVCMSPVSQEEVYLTAYEKVCHAIQEAEKEEGCAHQLTAATIGDRTS